jgi:hypothetical protein
MSPNAFIGKTEMPSNDDLGRALGSAKPVWDQLISDLAAQSEVTTQEWRCYSPKSGWALRLKRGKRTIVWLAPREGRFEVTFILGDKAVLAARQGGLSARIIGLIDQAEKYPEGTGVRLELTGRKDLPTVMKLAAIKLKN